MITDGHLPADSIYTLSYNMVKWTHLFTDLLRTNANWIEQDIQRGGYAIHGSQSVWNLEQAASQLKVISAATAMLADMCIERREQLLMNAPNNVVDLREPAE